MPCHICMREYFKAVVLEILSFTFGSSEPILMLISMMVLELSGLQHKSDRLIQKPVDLINQACELTPHDFKDIPRG